MDIYQPYTYHIAWTHIDKHYYGVRYAKNCSPEDLWKTYFTSSKIVEQYRKDYGEPNIIEIRKTFTNANDARMWERKVLQRLDVLKSEKWLNENIGGENFYFSSYLREDYVPWNKGKTGIYSEETLRQMSEAKKSSEPWNKGIVLSDDFRKSISVAVKEKWNDPEYRKKQESKTHYKDPKYRKKMSESQLKNSEQISKRQTGTGNSFYGRKNTEESNRKRSETLKATLAKQEPIVCESCSRVFTRKSGATRHIKRCSLPKSELPV